MSDRKTQYNLTEKGREYISDDAKGADDLGQFMLAFEGGCTVKEAEDNFKTIETWEARAPADEKPDPVAIRVAVEQHLRLRANIHERLQKAIADGYLEAV
jgi:hypothetical protein